jgi:hypothetical protein
MDFDSNFLEKEIVPIDSQKYDFECYIGEDRLSRQKVHRQHDNQ